MLYTKNGDRVVTIDSVTSLRPMCNIQRVATAQTAGVQIASLADQQLGTNRHRIVYPDMAASTAPWQSLPGSYQQDNVHGRPIGT